MLVRRFKAAKTTFSTDVRGPRQQGCVCMGQTATRDTITFMCPFWTHALPKPFNYLAWSAKRTKALCSARSQSISCYKRMSFAFISFSSSSVFLLVSFSSWGKPLDANALRAKSATVERLNLGRNGRLCFDVQGSFCPASTFRNTWMHSRQAHSLGQRTSTS